MTSMGSSLAAGALSGGTASDLPARLRAICRIERSTTFGVDVDAAVACGLLTRTVDSLEAGHEKASVVISMAGTFELKQAALGGRTKRCRSS